MQWGAGPWHPPQPASMSEHSMHCTAVSRTWYLSDQQLSDALAACLVASNTLAPAVLCCAAQIDLRFSSPDQGNLQVVVAPVLRFADVGFNAGEQSSQEACGTSRSTACTQTTCCCSGHHISTTSAHSGNQCNGVQFAGNQPERLAHAAVPVRWPTIGPTAVRSNLQHSGQHTRCCAVAEPQHAALLRVVCRQPAQDSLCKRLLPNNVQLITYASADMR